MKVKAMIKGKHQLFLIVSLWVLSNPSFSMTFSVNSTDDALDMDITDAICMSLNTKCTLRAAIQQANALPGSDRIEILAGTYLLTLSGADEDSGLSGDLDITDSVTIVGADKQLTIINAGGIDRIIDIHNTISVTLSNITLTGGVASGDSNSNAADGGAIRIFDGPFIPPIDSQILLNNLLIKDNTALLGKGGGISFNGSNATVTIDKVELRGNQALVGGGMNVEGRINIFDSFIIDNSATETGGGVFHSGDVVFENTRVENNRVGRSGGGISANGNTLFYGGTLNGNGVIAGNNQIVNGAGIYWTDGGNIDPSHVYFIKTDVSSNIATGSGGGLYINSSLSNADKNRVVIASVNIDNNKADANGGGILNIGAVRISDTRVLDNQAGKSAGGIYILAETAQTSETVIAHSVISRNRVTSTAALTVRGGGIRFSGGNLRIENTTISKNSASNGSNTGDGGGLYLSASIPIGPAQFEHVTLFENVVGTSGQAANLYALAFSSVLNIKHSIIANSQAAENCVASITSLDYNLDSANSCVFNLANDKVQTDPSLGQLQVSVGRTETHQPNNGSPIIGVIPEAGCLATDQVFQARRNGVSCDSGAFETNAIAAQVGEVALQGRYSVNESTANLEIILSRINGSTGQVDIDLITHADSATSGASGKDFSAGPFSVHWAHAEVGPKTINIAITDDSIYEAEEQFRIHLIDTLGSLAWSTLPEAIVTITDDDTRRAVPIDFAQVVAQVTEANRRIFITVERSELFSMDELELGYQIISAGTAVSVEDYILSDGSIIFPKNISRQPIIVEIIDDNYAEPAETLIIQLTEMIDPVILTDATKTFTLTINDDGDASVGVETLAFETTALVAIEGGTGYELVVVRKNGSSNAVSVDYKILSGATATIDEDFTIAGSGTLQFPSGVQQQAIAIVIVDDAAEENNESFTLELFNPQSSGNIELGQQTTAKVVIPQNDVTDSTAVGTLSFSQASYLVGEDAGVVTITINRSNGNNGELSVELVLAGDAQQGVDYTLSKTSLLFANQQSFMSVDLSIINDDIMESDEMLSITLSAATTNHLGTPKITQVIIKDDDTDNSNAGADSGGGGGGAVFLLLIPMVLRGNRYRRLLTPFFRPRSQA